MSSVSMSRRRSTRTFAGAALAALLASSAVPMAAAGGDHGGGDDDHDGRVVASGLDSPRHLSVTRRGEVYVAEAGTGGNDCIDVTEGEDTFTVCAGTTGAITRVSRWGHQSRVVKGLPSLDLNGEVIGPSDVERRGDTLTMTIGLGGPPEARDQFVQEHGWQYRRFATVQETNVRHHHRHQQGNHRQRLHTVADLADFETENNPHPAALDTNPNGLARDGHGWLVADAGGNDVLRVNRHDRLRLVTALEDGMADAPPFLGLPPGTQIPVEPVPTSAVRGPDGAVYISQLTGFPFPPGQSSIWRVGRDGEPRVWATGLTNVTDLAFDHSGRLYAVQLSDVGLLNVPENEPPSGSLVRVRRGSDEPRTVIDDLEAPFGVALHHGHAYITTCTVCTDGGQVRKFDLHH
jgi:hypothetical protein